MKSHKEITELLIPFVLGQLSERQASEITRHLVVCKECSAEVKRLGRILECARQTQDLSADEQLCESAKDAILTAAEDVEKAGAEPTINIQDVRRIIMKSRITKLAVAAAIIIAVMIGVNHFGGSIDGTSIALGEVVKAFSQATNVHIEETRSSHNGTIIEKKEIWHKSGPLFRWQSREKVVIDDGSYELSLNNKDKTAELLESIRPYLGFYLAPKAYDYSCAYLLGHFLEGAGEQPQGWTRLPQESTRRVIVYSFATSRHKGKAWIDAETNLPRRMAGVVIKEMVSMIMSSFPEPESPIWSDLERTEKFELVLDYEPIPDATFRAEIPQGYKLLSRTIRPKVLFGRVVDRQGNPVSGAGVYPSLPMQTMKDQSKTDDNGEFYAKKIPWDGWPSVRSDHFPMFLRAYKMDDPYNVAWTIIKHPQKWYWGKVQQEKYTKQKWEKRREEQRKSHYPLVEESDGVKLVINDEQELRKAILGSPGEMFDDGDHDNDKGEHVKLRDIVMVMTPAGVLTGHITDRSGKPIANATVWVKEMEMHLGTNQVFIKSFGSDSKKDWRALAITDQDGRYTLGNLPPFWDQVTLEIDADGYKIGELMIRGSPGIGIPEAPQIIKGCNMQLRPN